MKNPARINIEEMLSFNGILLLDTCVIHRTKSHSLPEIIYEYQNPAEIPAELIIDKSNHLANVLPLLERGFTIPEVIQEVNKYFEILNSQFNFHRKNIIKADRQEKHQARENTNLFGAYLKEMMKVIRKLEKKDITKNFSSEQAQDYLAISEAIKGASWKLPYKDYKKKHHTHMNLGTDEKLVAASLILSREKDIRILSSDYDLHLLLNFYSKNPSDKKVDVFQFDSETFKKY